MKTKVTNLKESPQYYSEVITLIEKSFGYKGKHSFEVDFYPLMNSTNHGNCYILLKDNTVVAHIAYLPKKLSINELEAPTCLIGAIAVDKKYRGQGLFSKLYQETISYYEKKSAFLLLWSDKAEMYNRYGFYEFGTIYQLGNIPYKDGDLNFHKNQFTDITEEDIRDMTSLYNESVKEIISVKRTTENFRTLLNIKSAELYTQRDKQNQITNYFFINKGFDLSEVIHECSFLNDKKLLQRFSKYKIWSPSKEFDAHQEIYLGLIKIGNIELFKEFIAIIFKNNLHIASSQSDELTFRFNNEDFTLSHQDFVTTVFGPGKALEFNEFDTTFYISGLDSI